MQYPAFVCVIEGPPGTGESWFCVDQNSPHTTLAEAERDAEFAKSRGAKVLRIDKVLGKGLKETVKEF